MFLVDRLVLTVFLQRLSIVFVSVIAVYSAVEVVDLINVSSTEALLRYPGRIPLGVVLSSPLVLLFSSCWATYHLMSTGQLQGISASGRSQRRALSMIPVVGVLIGAVVFGIANSWAPMGLAASLPRAQIDVSTQWRSLRSGEVFLRAGGMDAEGFYRDLRVIRFDQDGRPVESLEAATGRSGPSGLSLRDVLIMPRGDSPRHLSDRTLDLEVLGASTVVPPEQLGLRRLIDAREEARSWGRAAAPFEAELGLRVALSLACPICVLLGLVVGVVFGRRPGQVAAASVGLGISYWLVLSPLWAMATAGSTSAIVLGLVPAGIFGVFAMSLWVWALE